MRWRHATGTLELGDAIAAPKVAAIVNVTPDSFSDGDPSIGHGSAAWLSDLEARLGAWLEAGVAVLDLGAESTRPGAVPVAPEAELARLVPTLEWVLAWRESERAQGGPGASLVVSIDTRHASVARYALKLGADAINDVSGGAEPELLDHVSHVGAGLILGHMRGVPATMMQDISFRDVEEEVCAELGQSVARARSRGIPFDAIVVDPCLGFGKDATQSRRLLVCGGWLESRLQCPVMIGASRKRFLARSSDRPIDRDDATHWAGMLALEGGARLLRVHDPVRACQSIELWAAVRDATRARETPHA